MKYLAATIMISAALTGCTTPAQADKEAAWAKCEKLLDRASRSSCTTKALSEANAQRRADEHAAEVKREREIAAREREAAIEQALGGGDAAIEDPVPFVREPLE